MKNNTNQIMKLNIPIWIKYWLSKHKNASYILSEILTGTEFFLQDSAPKKFKIFDIIGRTTQESTTGKQLLDLKGYLTDRGVTYTENSDGSLTFTVAQALYSNPLQFSEEDIAVSLSGLITNGTATGVRIFLVNKANTNVGQLTASASSIQNISACKIRFDWSNSGTVTMKNIMLNTGSTAEPCEPYTGGEPAPNPNYPMAIKNTGDNGSVNEKVENKNLLKIQNDLHLIMNSNGTISLGSTSTICQILDVTNIDNLTFNGDFSLTDSQTIRVGLTNDFPAVGVQGTRIDVKSSNKTIDTSNYKYALCTFVSTGGSTAADIEKSFQIEEGLTATDYTAHSEQNISFPLAEGQKFYEGSYPDDDEKVHHKWGEVVLDGTVGGYNADYNWFYISKSNITNTIKSFDLLSNYFKNINYATFESNTNLNGICWNSTNLNNVTHLLIRNTNCTNVTEYKNWLAEVLPKVQFPLAEEQTEDFTEEQKTAWEQIKKARTYKNITHISSEDKTPAELKIQYYKEG